jgi:hypothetical protein
MASVAEREPSEHEIVGHVFGKASPILTWRPSPASKTAQLVSAISTSASDPGLRPSRAPTKRMVAWPLVKSVARERGHALRALGTLVALSLLCGSVLAVGIYVVLGEETGLSHARALPTRVAATHVTEATADMLMLSPPSGTAATDPASPAIAPAAPSPPPAVPASAHHGRAQRGHREAAAPPRAPHASIGGTRSSHRTT